MNVLDFVAEKPLNLFASSDLGQGIQIIDVELVQKLTFVRYHSKSTAIGTKIDHHHRSWDDQL